MPRYGALLALFALPGCESAAFSKAGDLGVSPGGSEDNAYAREIIEAGGIPRREHFTAEGIFSEHDLPLSGGEDCAEILCPLAAATPFSPIDGSGPQALVQVGFDTVLDAETFERRPLSVAVAVDVSGSMSGGKLDAVKHALHVMVDQLDAGDEMALVAFDDTAWVARSLTLTDESGRRDLDDAIEALQEGGGTNIEAGMTMAYGEVAPGAAAEGVEHRVMLFTDAQPNVDGTGLDTFLGMAAYYAEAGIGISVFGVGLDMGTELADAIAQTRGGNYHYLADEAAIRQVFDEEFAYLVSPVAYDLDVEVAPVDGVTMTAAWGAPNASTGGRLELGASTLFLSARDGGMGVSFEGEALREMEAGTRLATFALTYEEPDGAVVTDTVDVSWDGGATLGETETEADDVGVYKMAGLVDEFLALTAGADFCDGALEPGEAEGRIEAGAEHLGAIAAALADDGMASDETLMRKLAENLREGGRGACATEDVYEY